MTRLVVHPLISVRFGRTLPQPAAAEVIIGRAMTARPRDVAGIAQSLGSSSGYAGSVKEREIRRFLLTFLVHHEDTTDAPAQIQKIALVPPRGGKEVAACT